MDYEEVQQIMKEYGADAICGYIRNPEVRKERIKGYCFIRGGYCNDFIPQDENGCRFLKEWEKGLKQKL